MKLKVSLMQLNFSNDILTDILIESNLCVAGSLL